MFGGAPGALHVEAQKVEHAARMHPGIDTDDVDIETAHLSRPCACRIVFVQRSTVMAALTAQRIYRVPLREDTGRRPASHWD